MNAVVGALIPKRDETPGGLHVFPKRDPNKTMQTVQWMGNKSIKVQEDKVPLVTDDGDAIVKVTSSAICGSDLHLYLGAMPGMKKHDVLGHEFMGYVDSVGPAVSTLKPGDRVVVAFDICCKDQCQPCKMQQFSGCDNTNPSVEQEQLYGHHTSGIFGYSHLTGGYPGGQAEYVRVPLADNCCLKVPSGLSDDKLLFLSDILPTAWHANELAKVSKGDNVAIWGAGPVGILAAHCAQFRGANRVVLIDKEEYRLEFAKEKLPGLETINFKHKKTLEALHDMFKDENGMYVGPDVCIEAVGFHYTSTWVHWIEMALSLENDPSEILNELFYACRKGGRIGVVGVYSGFCNHFNIGAFMEKGLSISAGQCPVQKYWEKLLEYIEQGKLHPEMVITHRLPLDQAPHAYKMFNEKTDGCIKVILQPQHASVTAAMSEQ